RRRRRRPAAGPGQAGDVRRRAAGHAEDARLRRGGGRQARRRQPHHRHVRDHVEIPPRPSGDASLRLRDQQGDRHGAGPHHRGHAGCPHLRDVDQPPPATSLPPVGPHPHRRGTWQRRPRRRPPPRRRAALRLRRALARLVHRRLRRHRAALLVAGGVRVPQPAASRQPLVPRPRHGAHPRQHPRRPPRRVPRGLPGGGGGAQPPLRRGVRPQPGAVRPRLPRRRLAVHEPHGEQPERAPAVAAGVLRRRRRRQRQGVAVPPRPPPPLPPPHPQRQQRALLPPLPLRRPPLRSRRLRLRLPRQAGAHPRVPPRAVRDRRRRRRLRRVRQRHGDRPAVRRPGAVPRRPRRQGGDRAGDEVRDRRRRRRVVDGAGHVERAGEADVAVAVRQAGREGGGADAADRHVRVHQGGHRRADAPVPEREVVHGPGDGDAEGGDVGALGRDQPHRRQPPASRPPGAVRGAGAEVAAGRRRPQGVHDGAGQRRRRRGRVRAGAAPRRREEARGAEAGARVEERVQGAAGHGDEAAGAVPAAVAAGQPPLPLRRRRRPRLRLPLPHSGPRRQRDDEADEDCALVRVHRNYVCTSVT
ncbi:Os01g0126200, partial [Oryza sativa Japonica Group]